MQSFVAEDEDLGLFIAASAAPPCQEYYKYSDSSASCCSGRASAFCHWRKVQLCNTLLSLNILNKSLCSSQLSKCQSAPPTTSWKTSLSVTFSQQFGSDGHGSVDEKEKIKSGDWSHEKLTSGLSVEAAATWSLMDVWQTIWRHKKRRR